MALSNIGREPRREITESAIGIFAVSAYIGLDYLAAREVISSPPANVGVGQAAAKIIHYGPPEWFFLVFSMLIIGVVGPLVLVALLYLTHAAGEIVCGWFKAIGADPRPRQRY